MDEMVGVGVGGTVLVGDGDGLGVAVGEGVGVGMLVGDGDGLGVAVGEELGLTEGVGEVLGLAVGPGLTLEVAVGDVDGNELAPGVVLTILTSNGGATLDEDPPPQFDATAENNAIRPADIIALSLESNNLISPDDTERKRLLSLAPQAASASYTHICGPHSVHAHCAPARNHMITMLALNCITAHDKARQKPCARTRPNIERA